MVLRGIRIAEAGVQFSLGPHDKQLLSLYVAENEQDGANKDRLVLRNSRIWENAHCEATLANDGYPNV